MRPALELHHFSKRLNIRESDSQIGSQGSFRWVATCWRAYPGGCPTTRASGWFATGVGLPQTDVLGSLRLRGEFHAVELGHVEADEPLGGLARAFVKGAVRDYMGDGLTRDLRVCHVVG